MVAGDDSSTGTALAPGTALGGLAPLAMPSRGQLIATPTQNSAVTVKKKTVDRAILLQKKVGWQEGRVHVLWPGAAAIWPALHSTLLHLHYVVGQASGGERLPKCPQLLLAALPSNANPGTW